MKKIFGILKQSWFQSLQGVIAISALIWFLGPLLGFGGRLPFESRQNRMILILAIAVIWALYYLWKAFRARQKNKQMLDQISDDSQSSLSPEDEATDNEIGHLDSRLKEAVEALKGVRLGDKQSSDKQYLYQLPWYIIIGPPGAGKTTLLANSELEFPLSEKYGKEALHGVGGTRNCDWWFTNDAVLLDTAGRYTTQDSNKNVDKGSWLGFLDLLKKYRGRQPINGVIVAISLVDMMKLSEDALESHANSIKDRITELYEQLNITIPVYMMFTKSDLLAGFSDYFDDINREDRKQVWGTTFPLNEPSSVNNTELFIKEFELLEDRIHGQVLSKLEKERDLERRQAIYLFPQQFSSLKLKMNDFLGKVFQDSQFHKPIMFRGYYFTSATQEGTSIDRIMGSLASGFGIARQQLSNFSGQGKSFFINGLLKDVIFKESGLAGVNRKFVKKMQWVRNGLTIVIGLATIALAGLWFNSYQQNQKLIDEYEQQVKVIENQIEAVPYKGTLEDQLPLLNQLKRLTQSYSDITENPSIFARLGLYQGDSLRLIMDERYRELLRKILRPHAKANLEELISKNIDNPTALFGLLKTYLYLAGEAPAGATSPSIGNVDWDGDGNSNDDQDVTLSGHFNALLKEPPSDPITVDEGLVSQARELLSNDPAKLAYIQLKNGALNSPIVPDFKIAEFEGLSSISSSFERKSGNPFLVGIPSLFTKEGFSKLFLPKYNDIVKNLKEDRWVLGDSQQILSDTGTIKSTIQQLYQDDYIQTWSNLLLDLQIRPLENTKQASEILRPLTADSGNLFTHILKALQSETDFSDDNKLPLIGDAIELKKTLKVVDSHFKPLHKLVAEDQLKETMQLIDDLYKGLYQDISGGKGTSDKVKTTLAELNAAVDKLPEIMRIWLNKPILEAKQIIGIEVTKGATKELIQAAGADLCEPCEKAFKNKFPFNQRSKKGVDISEFNNFFAIGGVADTFKKSNLKETDDFDPSVVNTLDNMLAESERLRSVFFSAGNLNINLTLKLISASPDVEKIQLSIGSTKNNFFPGSAIRPQEVYSWPASPITAVANFRNPAIAPKFITLADATDQWGLFKLVRNDQIRIPAFGNAVFEVKTPTLKENPFKFFSKMKALKSCRCPK
ncbi:type VI secretion system membrane subunit TssM [Cocleimonas sp. KMM 6892]|uniref:type VI secretion system membrane subunit TssM n=1 Tax=unclassified Cocleimonas TaxID=2639732 RepID=UPI002DB6098C|nr:MULTISPECIES: type VI secretion system membrane subunit TssM [unclassified Cocleimonas]MEB8434444.1 type VI secretion system membrane subunit TssM [Cocleimonas sp. KMM 6892]MEC4717337.1 type VI secretion system membrane subunit TssM [Cocleimonas sp. KMM 6895]MEC4746716.1 type VI secretion system membrane subunit TssM [Cocleimonas sp. KMM 6896]